MPGEQPQSIQNPAGYPLRHAGQGHEISGTDTAAAFQTSELKNLKPSLLNGVCGISIK